MNVLRCVKSIPLIPHCFQNYTSTALHGVFIAILQGDPESLARAVRRPSNMTS